METVVRQLWSQWFCLKVCRNSCPVKPGEMRHNVNHQICEWNERGSHANQPVFVGFHISFSQARTMTTKSAELAPHLLLFAALQCKIEIPAGAYSKAGIVRSL